MIHLNSNLITLLLYILNIFMNPLLIHVHELTISTNLHVPTCKYTIR